MKDADCDKVRLAGRISKEAREHAVGLVKEGARALDIAEAVEAFIRDRGAAPAFPTCVSVDNVAAHYTPTHDDALVLERGNVVKIDLGAHVDGWVADTAVSVEVGTRNWARLIEATEHALRTAIEVVGPHVPTRMIGAAIERAITSYGFRPISNLTGHTIDRFVVHAGKSVPNVGDRSADVLERGDIVAIEPFATDGAGQVNGRRSGNIYRLVTFREVRPPGAFALLEHIRDAFQGLPFCERWCYRWDAKAPAYLPRLVRQGVLMTYPALTDVGGGVVSQTEHSMIVTEGGADVITA
jgi:methionyl aminopeptidase